MQESGQESGTNRGGGPTLSAAAGLEELQGECSQAIGCLLQQDSHGGDMRAIG
jgi:hypothetical protein